MELIRHVILSTASVLRHQSESIITFTLAGRLHAFTCVLRRLCASRFSQLINCNNRLPTRIALLSYLHIFPTRLKFLNLTLFSSLLYFSKNLSSLEKKISEQKNSVNFSPENFKTIESIMFLHEKTMFLFSLGSWASR